MISAPNHRLPLNGNKPFFFLWAILFICACTSQKRTIDKPSTTKDSKADSASELVEQFDPATGTVVLVPREEIKVDTVQWVEDDTPPLITDDAIIHKIPTADDPAEIALLMPFDAANARLFSDQQDPKLNRFLHYYGGIQIAMDDLEPLNLPIKIHAYDAEATTNSFAMLSRKPEIQQADIIVGPYEKQDLEKYAALGLSNETMVISPWRPAFRTDVENPFFLQLYPGLEAHVEALTAYIHQEYSDDDVYVVGRDNESERNRIKMFSENESQLFQELIVTDTTPDLLETDVRVLMDTLETTVFILPYYSRSDESFVNEFLRKLHADSHVRDIIVFGLPQWVGFTNLNPNYLESVNLHLSISSFVDVNHPDYNGFRTRFFNKFHVVPDINAFMGYDFMVWMARTVSKEGAEGLIQQSDRTNYGLSSGFNLQPVYDEQSTELVEMKVPLYYENRRIRILRYLEQDYKLAW